MREPLISATFILDSDETILEMMGDAEVVLGISRKSALKKPLAAVGKELDHMLRGLLDKAKKGRGVENYALSFKLGNHLVALRTSAIPYPLAALGKTGILVTMVSQEEKEIMAIVPEAERNKPLTIPGLAEELEVAREEDLAFFADPVFVLDGKGDIVFCNPSFKKLMEAGSEDLQASHLSVWLATAEPRKVVEQIIETVHLAPWRGELDLRTRTGREVVLSLTFSRLEEAKGKPGVVLGCAQDFTELRRLDRERVAEEARSLGRLQSAAVCIFAFTPAGRITFFNREAEKIFSHSVERAAGMTLAEVMGKENGERMLELAGRALDGRDGAPATLVMAGRHGRERFLRVRVAVSETDGGDIECIAAAEEVTEAEDLKAGVEKAARAVGFLSGCIALSSGGGSPEEVLAGFLAEVEALTGAAAGAVYRIEEDRMELASSHGHPGNFAHKAGTLRIRPGRLEVLETHAGTLLDLDADPAPDSTTSPRIFFRDWDDYRQAHLEGERPSHMLLPLRSGGEITGMVALAGTPSMYVEMEHLNLLERIVPWVCLVMEMGRPSESAASPAFFDDEARRRMAHELSTPLTYVRGFTQMLAADREQLPPESLDEIITNLDEGTARLVEIVSGYMPRPDPDE